MNISKIAMGTGALVLTVAAVFAGRASVKSTLTTFFVSTAGGNCKSLTVGTGVTNFTTSISGSQATIRTLGGLNARKLWKNCTALSKTGPVHFKGN